jgi:CubicO group peptidase (beta-lactamase class C family)
MFDVFALEALIQDEMAAARVPGLALAVVRESRVVYARGFGVTSVEEGGRPITPATLFRIGSITKTLTGTAVVRLVEQGKLALDARVREYLPWFALSDPNAAARVTLRMLLSHTAGLPHDHRPFGRRDPEALEARIREEVPRYPLVDAPGTRYAYSNTGIHALAHVAEVVTGRSYAALMEDLVFAPLQMRRTTFDPTVAMTYPLALAHTVEDGALRVEHRYADNAANYASGQAISTVLDLASFALPFLNEGRFNGQCFLSPASIEEMWRPHAEIPGAAGRSYGLTFGIAQWNGLRRVGHGGAITNFGARFQLLPEAHLGIMAVFNRLAPEFKIDAVLDEVLAALGNP